MYLNDSNVFKPFPVLCSRGAVGPLPVSAHLTSLVVGRTPYGLQVPVDTHPLRHL